MHKSTSMRWLVVAVSAVMLLVVTAARGDDPEPAPAPAPAGITAADLQAAMASIQIPEGLSEDDVSRIVEGAAQPGLSAAEVSKIVSDHLDAQPGISAEDLQKAVDTAVMEAGGITAADLQSAIAGIQIPEGLSEADVSKIVSDQLAAQPGITAAALQKAVDTAVMEAGGITAADLQSAIAGIQIPEGLSEADVTRIVEGAAQPGLSAAEVSKIVSDQLDAQPGITAMELQKAVDEAVMAAGGITAADLRGAIAGIQIPEGLSAAEVSKIVSDQLDEQPGITAMDLQKAVDAAVAVAAAVPAAPAPADVMQYGTLDVAFQQVLTFGNDYTVRTAPEIGFVGTASGEPVLKLSGDGEVVPQLITEWSLDDSGTVWTFKLREDVEFHRGWGNMTSDDVIFSMQEISGEDSVNAWAGTAREYVAVEGGGITKVDDYTLSVDLVAPKPESTEGHRWTA